MELVRDFTCPACKHMCTKSEMIYIHNDRLFHSDCRTANAVCLTLVEMATLGEEVLFSHCHPQKGATFAIKDTYYLLCFDCQNQGFAGFNISSTKMTLASTLRSIILQYSSIIPVSVMKQWKKTLKKDSPSKKIHAALVESCFYINSSLLCTEHVQYITAYDQEKCRLTCDCCENNSRANLEYIDYIIPHCITKIKELKTPGFSKDFLPIFINILYNSPSQVPITDYDKKKFLLLMKEALSNLSCSDLDSDCVCLYCREKFGYGIKQAVQLHEKLRHEVCIKCFLTNNISQCIIDWEVSVRQIIICKYPKNFLNRDQKCFEENNVCIFDIKNEILPFKICCIENFCQKGLQSASTTLTRECLVCSCSINSNDVQRNEELIKKLKFLEVQCPDHEKIALIFNKNEPIVKCSMCRDYNSMKINLKLYSSEYLMNIVNLFEKCKEHLKKSFVANMIKSIYPLIPGQKIYDTLWQLESLASGNQISSNLVTINRFSSLSPPDTINIYEQWKVINMTKETLKLSLQGTAELFGIIIGNPIDFNSEVSVFINDSFMQKANLQTDKKSSEIIFNNPVKIHSEWTQISISYSGSGKSVIHGYPSGLIKDLSLNDSKLIVDADENKMINGNNAIGGPILGFIFNKIHLNEEESYLYNSISRFQNNSEDLFVIK